MPALAVTVTGGIFTDLGAGGNAFHGFTTRQASLPDGEVDVTLSAGGDTVPVTASYAARSCG